MPKLNIVLMGFLILYCLPSSAIASELLNSPNRGSSGYGIQQMTNAMFVKRCATTNNTVVEIAAPLKDQPVFKHFGVFYEWKAQKGFRDLGYRSCQVLRKWPQDIKSELKKIVRDKKWLRAAASNIPARHLQPEWFRIDFTTDNKLLLMGIEIYNPEKIGDSLRAYCGSLRLIKNGKQFTEDKLYKWYKEKGIVDEERNIQPVVCSDSPTAERNDQLVAKKWKELDNIEYGKKYKSGFDLTYKYVQKLSADTDAILAHEQLKQKSLNPKQDKYKPIQ